MSRKNWISRGVVLTIVVHDWEQERMLSASHKSLLYECCDDDIVS